MASKERIFSIFKGMHLRCYRQKSISYRYYGAKGIVVCHEWQSYELFKQWALANGYQDTLMLDRIDPSQDYRPDNCRWVDAQTNSENRGNVTWVTAFGETKTVKAWTRDPRCLVDPHSLKMRLIRGYPPEMSMQEPGSAFRIFIGPYEQGMQSKLTSEKVKMIRDRHAQGDLTIAQLAIDYGISESAVSRIVHRKSWRHVQ